jgi:Family of unknown function (DUF6941)
MPMMVTMLLCDAAQAVDNKLYVLGGGWSVTGPAPAPSAIALHLKVPWDEANLPHTMRLELIDSDGEPVLGSPEGAPIVIETQFEVGRAAGLPPGTPIDLSVALNFGPIPLAPGGRYEWRLTIDGRAEADWHLAFSTRPDQT